jgi:Domain of unknown function (DUF4158)
MPCLRHAQDLLKPTPVPVVADTIYPRLVANPGAVELEGAFTPTAAELVFATRQTRRAGPRLALLVLLKTFQRLGYFVQVAEIPPAIVAHVAAAAGLADAVAELATYDRTTYRTRLL